MNTNGFVWILSHDEVNQNLAPGLGAAHGLDVQARLLKEGLPDGDCRALVVDLHSVAPERPAPAGARQGAGRTATPLPRRGVRLLPGGRTARGPPGRGHPGLPARPGPGGVRSHRRADIPRPF